MKPRFESVLPRREDAAMRGPERGGERRPTDSAGQVLGVVAAAVFLAAGRVRRLALTGVLVMVVANV